jgi:hypothetical protein
VTSTRDDLIASLGLVWDDQQQAWLSPVRGHLSTPFRVLVAAAVDCARPIIEDGAATDDELAELLPVAQEALQVPAGVDLTDAQIAALARVAALGSEYMDNNGYAEDESFPEDAHVARQVGGMREDAYTYALASNFARRWQD